MAAKNCWHYRCAHRECYARRSLLHPVSWYIRVPKCHRCGRKDWWFDKTYLPRREAATCRCDGIHHPHRKGMITRGRGCCRFADPERASERRDEAWPAADGVGTWIKGEYIPF